MPYPSVFASSQSQKRWIEHMRQNYILNHAISPCVLQVPESLKDTKPEAYVPQIIGLGPYHHFRPEVQQMERKKRDAVKSYLKEKNISDLVEKCPERFEPKIRSCYDGYLDLDKETLAWVVIVDGLFLLHFMSTYVGKSKGKMQKIYSNIEALVHDIMMLENQIPIILLGETRKFLDQSYNVASDTELKQNIHDFCEKQSPLQFATDQRTRKDAFDQNNHMLHYMYKLIVKNQSQTDDDDSLSETDDDEDSHRQTDDEDSQRQTDNNSRSQTDDEDSQSQTDDEDSQRQTDDNSRIQTHDEDSQSQTDDEDSQSQTVYNFQSRKDDNSSQSQKDDQQVKNVENDDRGIRVDNLDGNGGGSKIFANSQVEKSTSRVGELAKEIGLQAGEILEQAIEEFNTALADAKVAGLKVSGNVEKVSNILRNLQKILHLDHMKGSLGNQIDIPSASRLNAILKLKFKPLPDNSGIGDIELKNNTLHLPVITLNSNSEVILRNLVAYESTSKMRSTKLRDYMNLICGIIKSEKDVALLKKEEIIKGQLPDAEIVRMCKGIKEPDDKPDDNSTVHKTVTQVNEEFDKVGIVKACRLTMKCFAALVKSIKQLFPILVLLFLALQSFCEIYDCRRSSYRGAALRNSYLGELELDPKAKLMLPRKVYRY